jgi:hypothetical protein
LRSIILIPRDPGEDIEGLPVNVKAYSEEMLGLLKSECLKVVALVLASRSFQTSVTRAFTTGDVSIMSKDYFSPIAESLLSLTLHNQNGKS